MDIPRPDIAPRKRRRRILLGSIASVAVLLVTLGLRRLEPAAPGVDRASVWIDEVKRGSMLRQVRGLGSLVPEEIRWVVATTEGRLERIVVLPGTLVKADTVVLELSNPEVELAALDAESQLRAAEAQLTELRVRLESQALDQQAAAARVESEYAQARLRAETDEQLAHEGLIADLTRKLSSTAAEELAARRSRPSSPCSAPRWSSAAPSPCCGATRPGPCASAPGSTGSCSRCRSRWASG